MSEEDEIAAEASRRTLSHASHASQRVLAAGHDLVGLRGEAEFGRVFHLKVDMRPRPGGDGGVDYYVGPYKVDVKCSRKAHLGMLVEAAVTKPKTIYVWSSYDAATDRASLVGWQWGAVLMRGVPRDTGRGIVNYEYPCEQLRSIEELLARATMFRAKQ